MNGTLRKMVLAIFFSFAVLYMLFLFPYVELCRTGKYDGSITVSGNYTDWEITEARTSIYTCRVDGDRHYAVSEMWLNGKHFGMDCPALTPGKEVTAEDYDGNFWYVFLPQEQARIPAQRFKTALFALLSYLCVLSGVYWFYWRPRLIAEKEPSAVAKEKFQEKVREMEQLKSSIFSDKKDPTEPAQEVEEDPFADIFRIHTPEEREKLRASETPEERKAREAENKKKMMAVIVGMNKSIERRKKIQQALIDESERTGLIVPFEIQVRYGQAHFLPADDNEPLDTSEKPNESPEMAYYRRFAENLNKQLIEEQNKKPDQDYMPTPEEIGMEDF